MKSQIILTVSLIFVMTLISLTSLKADRLQDYVSQFSDNHIEKADIVIPDIDSFDAKAMELEDKVVEKFLIDKEWKSAIKDFKKALKKEPRLVYSAMFIGLYYRSVEMDEEKAVKVLDKAIEYHPDIPQLYVELAETNLIFEKLDEFVKYMIIAHDKGFPRQEGTYYNMALASSNIKRYYDCIRYCKEGLNYKADSERCRQLLFKAYLYLNDRVKALNVASDTLEYYILASDFYIDLDRYKDARMLLDEALELYPHNEFILLNNAQVLFAERKHTECLATIDSLLKSNPDNCRLLKAKALYLAKSGWKDQAIELYDNISQNCGDDIGLAVKMAYAFLQKDEFETSRVMYLKALALDPNNKKVKDMIKFVDFMSEE